MTALVVDEAQALSDILLEEVRLLANVETSNEKIFPVVLIGQPELAVRLNERPLQQLKQRVALRAHARAAHPPRDGDYIAERIRIAGGDIRTVFAPEAVAAIFGCSGGIPRTISVVCDNALVSAFALDQRPVGWSVIADVCRDFDLPAPTRADTGAGSNGAPKAAPAAPPAVAAASLIRRPVPAAVPLIKTTSVCARWSIRPQPRSQSQHPGGDFSPCS